MPRPSIQNKKGVVYKVRSRLAEFLENIQVGECSRDARDAIELIATKFRTVLELSDMKMLEGLQTFGRNVIADVPVCSTIIFLNNFYYMDFRINQ